MMNRDRADKFIEEKEATEKEKVKDKIMNDVELLEIQNIELDLLVDAMYQRYGYDYKHYLKSHIKRRVLFHMESEGLDTISELTGRILYDHDAFEQLLRDLSINVTEMFRFPPFFEDIRKQVIPMLKTYPSINVWHAGCSTGEEVISMAIILEEEGLLERSRIYATDIDKKVLDKASKGIYPISEIKKWTKNYQDAGGKRSFSDYYTAKYDSVLFNRNLYESIVFLEHNLTQDQSFIGANLILCRNVMIYFDKELKDKVLRVLDDSLLPGGVLGIGSKESLKFTEVHSDFEILSQRSRLYNKKVESSL